MQACRKDTLYQYIHSKQPGWIVVGNPGATPVEDYARLPVADILVPFENYGGYDVYTPPGWQANYLGSRFADVVYNVASPATMLTDVGLAASRHTGWLYITDAVPPIPYGALPSYWTQLVAAVGGTQYQ
jgi:hypothetical protein